MKQNIFNRKTSKISTAAKWVLWLIIVLLAVSSAYFLTPQKALAVWPVEEIGDNLFTNIYNSLQNAANFFKENALDVWLWKVINGLIDKMAQDVVQWIKEDGFNGNPAFMQDFEGLLKDAADREFGRFIKSNELLSFLCDPFSTDVRMALSFEYQASKSLREKSQCSITGILNEAGATYEQFVDNGDFLSGGWRSWFELVTKPQNNPYGARLIASSKLNANIGKKQIKKEKDIDLGKGFFSWKQCPADKLCPQGTTEVGGECLSCPPGFDLIGERCFNTDTSDSMDATREEKICAEVKSAGGITYTQPMDEKTVTPGSVIEDELNNVLFSGQRRLEVADEFNEIINALFGKLLDWVFSSGEGLTGSVDYDWEQTNASYVLSADDITVPQGGSAEVHAYLTWVGGNNIVPVKVDLPLPPDGVRVTKITGSPCSPTCSSTITVEALDTATPGTFPVYIMGTPGSGQNMGEQALFYLTITDRFEYEMTSDPNPITIAAGSSGTANIILTRLSGRARLVRFGITSLPEGIIATPTDSECIPNDTCGAPVTFSVSSEIVPGTYYATVTGTPGSKGSLSNSSRITIVVVPSGMPVVRLWAEPLTVPLGGGNTMLRWEVDNNPDSCEAESVPQMAEWTGSVANPASDFKNIHVSQDTEFTLSCVNEIGSAAGTTQVTLGNPPEINSVTCSVSPSSITVGGSATWSATPQGGTPPYTYTWSGHAALENSGVSTNSVTLAYNTVGLYSGYVVVTDLLQQTSGQVSCGTLDVSNSANADVTNPQVAITAPASGDTVLGVITITATAWDPANPGNPNETISGVNRVEFTLNGFAATPNPATYNNQTQMYEAIFDTRATDQSGNKLTPNGIHALSAKVYDNADNSYTHTMFVEVNNP
jgi:hypothetical protein